MDYATKRTPARISILIAIIWITSVLISSSHSFPIFRTKQSRQSGQCQIIGNPTYTIISTFTAFYIPLIGMCIIYWKIFQAAKFRIRRKAFNTNPPPRTALVHQRYDTLPPSSTKTPNYHTDRKASPFTRLKFTKKNYSVSDNSDDVEPDNTSTHFLTPTHHNDHQLKSLKQKTFSLLKKKYEQNREVQLQKPTNNSTLSTGSLITSTVNGNDSNIPVNTIDNPLATLTSSPSNSPRLSSTHVIVINTSTSVVTRSPAAISRKKIDIKRERKAIKTLGVVMGCFILCWLPYFIEETVCGVFHLTINEKLFSVLTWLGYLNSMLNPVIYTIFAPDFRQAFGKILFRNYRRR